MLRTIVDVRFKISKYTSRVEPWWAIIGAPIIQEPIFRFIPYQFFYLPTDRFWEVGLVSSLIFASIHWYFGKYFVIYAFVGGMVLWWTMVNFGLIGAIIAHSLVNVIDLSLGWRKFLSKLK